MNLAIRSATRSDCPGLARVQVDSFRSTYRGLLPAAYLAHFTYQEQEQDWQEWLDLGRGDGLYVAVDGEGEIGGYALGQPGSLEGLSYQGELAALHVRHAYQRQGVGSTLFLRVSGWLEAQGCSGMFCWVLRENPACGFYERLGGVRVGEKPWMNNHYFGVEVVEVAYGWEAGQNVFNHYHANK